MPPPSSDRVTEQALVSELVIYPSREEKKIVAFLDHRDQPGWERQPFVIATPKYGESKKNNLQLSYLMAANGLNVLRFDHTHHVGESEGSMFDFTLSGAVSDIHASIDFLQRRHGVTQVTLVASSLSARPALRAAASDVRVRHLVSIVGVVDVRDTLFRVYREDLIGESLDGRVWGVGDMLGHEADFDVFLRNAIEHDLHDFEGVLRDLEKTEIPLTLFAAEDDAWVNLEQVRQLAERFGNVRLHRLAGVMHEVRENAEGGDRAFRTVVREVLQWATGAAPAEEALVWPDKRVVLRQNKEERLRLQRARPPKEGEPDFWSGYLKRYELMEKVGDYQEYLNLVGDLLGPIAPGEVLLDAGCGNGLLGLWLAREVAARGHAAPGATPPVYVGIDLTPSGLRDALERHTGVLPALPRPPLGLAYLQLDFDAYVQRLPGSRVVDFDDGTFDKIVCSLLISYLKHPEELMREMRRLLRPGGRIVVSSMKPFCDLSVLYRDFVEQTTAPAELEAARNLLRAAGQIKLKEDQGYYRFYYREELIEVLRQAGFEGCEAVSSLANQAFVAVAQK